jgi:hypothetical protein
MVGAKESEDWNKIATGLELESYRDETRGFQGRRKAFIGLEQKCYMA